MPPDPQLDQINEMNASKVAKELDIDSYDKDTWKGITSDIQTGKYNTEVGKDYVINKCNLFASDILQKYYGIKLPRRGEFEDPFIREHSSSSPGGRCRGWEDNPISAADLNIFFRYASLMKGTGITEVNSMEGSKLSAEGKPVIVLGGGHATLSAPHQRWPLIYRSDLSRRGSDTRTAVGLRPSSGCSFYDIDPKKYKKFREILSKFKPDDIINPYRKDAAELRRQLKEIK